MRAGRRFLALAAAGWAAGPLWGDSSILSNGLSAQLTGRVYSHNIGGDKTQSVLKEGTFHEERFIAEYDRTISGTRLRAGLNVRGTNDRLADPKTVDLKNYYLGLSLAEESLALTVGNAYADFTPYVINRGLEGAVAKIKMGSTTLIPIYGQTVERQEGSVYQRLAQGGRLTGEPSKALKWGASYVQTHDRASSLDDDSGVSRREKGAVVGADAAWTPGGFALEGEGARSDYDEEKSGVSQTGTAYRAKARYRARRWKLEAERERVGTDFISLSGWANADREITKGKLGLNPIDWAGLDIAYETYRNNLDGSKAYAERVSIPQATLNLVLGRRTDLQAGYKTRSTQSNDEPRTVDKELDTWSGALNMRLGAWRPALAYEANDGENLKNSSETYKNDYWDVSLRGSWGREGGWLVSPHLSWRRTRDRWTTLSQTDTTRTWLARLNLQRGRYVELNGSIQQTDTDRETGGTETDRTTWSAEAAYRIGGRSDRTLTAAYSENDNDREGATPSSYTERVTEARLNFKF